MYTFTSTEIKTNSTHLKIGLPCHNVEIILCCQNQHCFPACLYVNCFDVYFILLKILEVYAIKPCSVYFISYRQMNHLCIEHCCCRGKARTESDMFLGAPYVLLTSVKISLSERKLLYIVK